MGRPPLDGVEPHTELRMHDVIDPYRNYRFVITCSGEVVAGVSVVSDMTPHVSIGRGVSHSPGFAQWAADATARPRDLIIVVRDDAARPAERLAYRDCRPLRFVAIADVDGTSQSTLIERATFEYAECNRDDD